MTSFFDHADTRLFAWRRDNPYVSERERDLFVAAFGAVGPIGSLLSVGMGEGTDAVFLSQVVDPDRAVGVDLSVESLGHCREVQPEWQVACADGMALPFADGEFDCVYCKDVCHHVKEPGALIAEMFRVLRTNGWLILIEANGMNPIIFLQGLVMSHERMVWRTSARQLVAWVGDATEAGAERIALQHHDPFPLWRVLLHYRFGIPALARYAAVRRGLRGIDGLGSRVLPHARWAYLVALVRKPEWA